MSVHRTEPGRITPIRTNTARPGSLLIAEAFHRKHFCVLHLRESFTVLEFLR